MGNPDDHKNKVIAGARITEAKLILTSKELEGGFDHTLGRLKRVKEGQPQENQGDLTRSQVQDLLLRGKAKEIEREIVLGEIEDLNVKLNEALRIRRDKMARACRKKLELLSSKAMAIEEEIQLISMFLEDTGIQLNLPKNKLH